ncbi:MAG: hypothetical protein A4E53_00576 [Pelotomaculum sp. PtaB.Bin104]|nr:MAG: hypothetical protein A4E53_00576 [Pelotomaculum sp. PtaB.Bin104]
MKIDVTLASLLYDVYFVIFYGNKKELINLNRNYYLLNKNLAYITCSITRVNKNLIIINLSPHCLLPMVKAMAGGPMGVSGNRCASHCGKDLAYL